MPDVRDWGHFRAEIAGMLERRTGKGLAAWKRRVSAEKFSDEAALRAWLKKEGVTGYPQMLLVYERFGYPDFLTASADELLDAQFKDRAQLRPVYDAVIAAVQQEGEVVVQVRKTYVSLLTVRRTFARIRPTTRQQLDVALRLDGVRPSGRLFPSRIHDTMPVELRLASTGDLDPAAVRWIRRAYAESV